MKHQRITLFDLYLRYSYKYRNPRKNMGHYHFPLAEITRHKHSLEFKDWKKIVKCYFKHLYEYLKSGRSFKLPQSLGYLQLCKSKSARVFRDFEAGKELMAKGELQKGEFVKIRRYFFNGYYPVLVWHKRHLPDSRFQNKEYLKVTLTSSVWKQYWKELRNPETAHLLYNLNDK